MTAVGSALTHNFNCKNLEVACRLAEKGGVTTGLLTGKGEPTLFPSVITTYLQTMSRYFPLIELQTNGLIFTPMIGQRYGTKKVETDADIQLLTGRWRDYLEEWNDQGLTTVSLSIAHYENNRNREIYCDSNGEFRFEYPDLATTIKFLHNIGLSVRLSCIGLRDYIDDDLRLRSLIRFAKNCKVEQLTWRPVTTPEYVGEDDAEWVKRLSCDPLKTQFLTEYVRKNGTLLLRLPHGAEVFDIQGQNLCLSNCLTRQPDTDVVRQLIYMDGHLYYDWCYEGAIIL